jgi:hypothetical protein
MSSSDIALPPNFSFLDTSQSDYGSYDGGLFDFAASPVALPDGEETAPIVDLAGVSTQQVTDFLEAYDFAAEAVSKLGSIPEESQALYEEAAYAAGFDEQDLSAYEQHRAASNLTPSLQNGFSTMYLKEGSGNNLSEEDMYNPFNEDSTVASFDPSLMHLAAPSAKRNRDPSFSLSIKKLKEIPDLGDVLDHWMMAPSVETNSSAEMGENTWNPDSLNLSYDDAATASYLSTFGLSVYSPYSHEINYQTMQPRPHTTPPSLQSFHRSSIASMPRPRASISRYASPALSEGAAPSRKHKCPNVYCSKVYKNSNGLKYHLERGNCELESADAEALGDDTPEDVKVARRPYYCRVTTCGKKYKNLNGLKYHARIEHPELNFKAHVKGHLSTAGGADEDL